MPVRGIRGAIDVSANTAAEIERATQQLLTAMVTANKVDRTDIISVFLTMTTDLDAAFPAMAARKMGWTDVPLLDAQEIEVQNAMPRVIRVLLHVESPLPRDQIRHVYLGSATALRPDLSRP